MSTRSQILLSVLCALATLLLTAPGLTGMAAAVLWIASLVLAAGALPASQAGPSRTRSDWGAMLAVGAGCVLLSLFRITSIPPGLWVDELAAAADSIVLVEQRAFSPFGSTPLFDLGPEWVHVPNLYLYFAYVVIWLGRFSYLGVKLISVLPGVLAPMLLYGLSRRVMDRLPAFTAAALLAVSHWHITLNRWGWNEVLSTTLAILMFSLLLRAEIDGQLRAYFLAGVVGGLSIYAYPSSRLVVLAAIVVLVAQVIVRRTRASFGHLGLFVWAMALSTAPHVLHWLRTPGVFNVRVTQLSILPSVLGGEWEALLHNLASYSMMFLVKGDSNPRHNLPGQPMLDLLTGILVVAGLVIVLLRWRRVEAHVPLAWLACGLLGGILTHPETAPNAYRTGIILPACMLLAGFALASLWKTPGLSRLPLPPIVAGVIIAHAATVTAISTFVERPRCRDCWAAVFEGVQAEAMRTTLEGCAAEGVPVLVDVSLSTLSGRPYLDILMRRRQPELHWSWTDIQTLPAPEALNAVILVSPLLWEQRQHFLGGLPFAVLRGPWGDEILIVVSADQRLLRSLRDRHRGPSAPSSSASTAARGGLRLEMPARSRTT